MKLAVDIDIQFKINDAVAAIERCTSNSCAPHESRTSNRRKLYIQLSRKLLTAGVTPDAARECYPTFEFVEIMRDVAALDWFSDNWEHM